MMALLHKGALPISEEAGVPMGQEQHCSGVPNTRTAPKGRTSVVHAVHLKKTNVWPTAGVVQRNLNTPVSAAALNFSISVMT